MRGEFFCSGKFSADWSIGFHRPYSHFHILERGSAWLTIDGEDAVQLKAGDLVILPLGAGHVLSSHPGLKSVRLEDVIGSAHSRGTLFQIGDGDDTKVVCGEFSFEGALASRLLAVLPRVLHLRLDPGQPQEWLQLSCRFLVNEAQAARPGSAITIARLLDLLFILAVRDWGARNSRGLGWLGGLGDTSIGKALSAIHGNPAKGWTVTELARVSSLSRSAFANRFNQNVGSPPLKYLASWRLNLAAEYLRADPSRVGEIAQRVGYGSEAAMTRAFKIQFGVTPGQFRRMNT